MPDTPLERGEPAANPSGLEPRVAVLEEIARRIDAKFDALAAAVADLRAELRADIAGLRGEVAGVRGEGVGLRGEVAALRAEVAEVRGTVRTLPTAWQMMTAIVAGQVALAAMLLGAARLFGFHN